MKLTALIVLGLLVGCGAPGRSASSDRTLTPTVTVTHPTGSVSRMTSTSSAGVDRELLIKGGTLLIRFDDSGIRLNLADFPGENITRYFDELQTPMHFKLPDGTIFIYRGDSFDVGGETYEITPGSGITSYDHPGVIRRTETAPPPNK
jgi:hypothetical protein